MYYKVSLAACRVFVSELQHTSVKQSFRVIACCSCRHSSSELPLKCGVVMLYTLIYSCMRLVDANWRKIHVLLCSTLTNSICIARANIAVSSEIALYIVQHLGMFWSKNSTLNNYSFLHNVLGFEQLIFFQCKITLATGASMVESNKN